MLNLDTHILIKSLSGDLTSKERKLLESEDWAVCPIVYWEITKLNQLGRIEIDLDSFMWRQLVTQIELLPLTYDVVKRVSDLDFKSDPADELIAATSLAYDIPLVTRDRRILKSKMLPFAL